MKAAMAKSIVEFDKTSSPSNYKYLTGIFKCVVFVLCLSGFSYQVTKFVTHFYTYPTVISIQLENPENFVLPAVTFCNVNPVIRSEYCAKYPDNCEKPQDMEEFCKKQPHYCKRKSNMSDFRIPKFGNSSGNSFVMLPFQDIRELGQNISRLLLLDSGVGEPAPVFLATNIGISKYLPCFSQRLLFESHADPYLKRFPEEAIRDSPTGIDLYTFQVEEHEMFDSEAKPGIWFSIYNPFVASNPYTRGIFMEPGKFYGIEVRLEKESLLPHPYKTDCIDYEELWEKNKMGPRSQMMCRHRCWNSYSLSCWGCIFNPNVITNNHLDSLCDSWDTMHCANKEEKVRIRKKCERSCKKDCTRLMYPLNIKERLEKRLTKLPDGNNMIVVEMFVNDPEILVRSHQPQYMEVELFSYIGGFMGCWLGISIWALSGILRNIFTVAIAFMKLPWKNTRDNKNLQSC